MLNWHIYMPTTMNDSTVGLATWCVQMFHCSLYCFAAFWSGIAPDEDSLKLLISIRHAQLVVEAMEHMWLILYISFGAI